MEKKERKTRYFQFRLTEGERKMLHELASRYQVPASELVRFLIRQATISTRKTADNHRA